VKVRACARQIALTFVAAELDLFLENPLEFVRQDIEGSDSDTRRRVASDLVRNLLKHFEDRVSIDCSRSCFLHDCRHAGMCRLLPP
jgi:hypothetical protein